MTDSPEVAISFTETTEYVWTGPLSSLPAAVRKGVLGKDGSLDMDKLGEQAEHLDDEVMRKLARNAEARHQEFDITEIEEA